MKILKLYLGMVLALSTYPIHAQGPPPPPELDSTAVDSVTQVITPISEKLISNSALYFDGVQVDDHVNYEDQPGYDFKFGRQISPHGDCMDFFGKYVFLTWYRGGEEDRHVMLSRYNIETGALTTIQFDHQHNGYLNNPNIGEAHNTIAVGISHLDSTIHLLYDMHAYSATRPEDGSLANDYFRYQYSVAGGATVSDTEFTKNLFNPKQLYLKEGEDYTGLTYPEFFTNLNGELMVKMRRGGNSNGKFMFAKYNPTEGWSEWTDFNILDASKSSEINYDWGLYGSFKYQAGKMRIGFSTRYNISNDRFIYNNGFHYAYSDDPTGKSQWYNAKGEPFDLPLIDPDFIKISEPGDEVSQTGVNEVRISVDADWSVNDREDIHFITSVNGKYVHTFKKSSDTEFTTTSEFPGGELVGVGNNMYLVGLEDSRPAIYRANGGTNDWIEVYKQRSGRKYMFGVARIYEGHLYYYLMEDTGDQTSDANPIHILVYKLADELPTLGFLNIADNDVISKNTDLIVRATTTDPYNNLSLFVNDELVSTLNDFPYTWSDHPLLNNLTDPSYSLKLVATNNEGDSVENSISITTVGQSAHTADGLPHPVPGAVQFVDYDDGGENIAWWDRSEQDPSKYSYRGTDKVDISSAGTQIVYIQGSALMGYEWLEYTINVAKTGSYDLYLTHEKARSGEFDQLSISFPDEEKVLMETYMGSDRPSPGVSATDLVGKFVLTEGEHVLRFTMLTYGFNLVSFEFKEAEADPIEVTFYDGKDTTVVIANEDGTVNLPPDPTREDEVFVQWITADREPFDENTVVIENTEVFAQWEWKTFAINITSEHGTVTTSPDQTAFQINSKVKLTAVPDEDYEFVGWSGDVTSTANPITISVKGDINITAEYEEIEEEITLNTLHEDHIKVYPNPSDQYVFIEGVQKGSTITLFNLGGSILKAYRINKNKEELDISELKSGQYIMLIKEPSSKTYYRKVIIE